MLKNLSTIISGATLAFLGWIGISIVELKTDTAVVKEKVASNYEMIKPMWQDFLVRSAKYDEHKSKFNELSNIHAATEKE